MQEECNHYERGVHTLCKRTAHNMKKSADILQDECILFERGVRTIICKRSAYTVNEECTHALLVTRNIQNIIK